jgi:hypothetical protein
MRVSDESPNVAAIRQRVAPTWSQSGPATLNGGQYSDNPPIVDMHVPASSQWTHPNRHGGDIVRLSKLLCTLVIYTTLVLFGEHHESRITLVLVHRGT